MNNMKFGECVKQLRLTRGWSLRDFCLKYDLDPSNWSKVERGKMKPSLPAMTMIMMFEDLTNFNASMHIRLKDLYHIARQETPTEFKGEDESKLVYLFSIGRELTTDKLKALAETLRRA
jgi:transcriptional regulator with XRE-family HTH domain